MAKPTEPGLYKPFSPFEQRWGFDYIFSDLELDFRGGDSVRLDYDHYTAAYRFSLIKIADSQAEFLRGFRRLLDVLEAAYRRAESS